MIIDKETGEIIDQIDRTERQYDTHPYQYRDDYPTVFFTSDILSVDDMNNYMSIMVDRRRIRESNDNDLLTFFENCLGYKALGHDLFKHTESLSVSQYKLLDKLGALVEYKNIIMTTREDLCEHLGCFDNNLIRKLNTVGSYLKILTQEDGIRRGEIKILINPMFFYIYEYQYYDLSRRYEITQWYMTTLYQQSPVF